MIKTLALVIFLASISPTPPISNHYSFNKSCTLRDNTHWLTSWCTSIDFNENTGQHLVSEMKTVVKSNAGSLTQLLTFLPQLLRPVSIDNESIAALHRPQVYPTIISIELQSIPRYTHLVVHLYSMPSALMLYISIFVTVIYISSV